MAVTQLERSVARFRGPLADSYPAAVVLVVCALVPYLMVTAAVLPLLRELVAGLGLTKPTLDIVISLSEGAYAFGTVLAVQFAVHLPARRMLLVYVTGFLISAVVCAWSPDGTAFLVAFVVEGLCTSLMLIAAVPPLVIGWPVSKMPVTGTIMNLCIFGAVALGPTLGAMESSAHQWRPLFAGVAGISLVAVLFAVLTYEDQPPQDHSAPWDFAAITLAGVGCFAAFFGAGLLQSAGPGPLSLIPLIGGAGMVVALVVYQFRSRAPLMPVRQLATTIPTAGIVVAMSASAAAFGLMELVLTALQKDDPVRVGLLFLPEFGAAAITAALFGLLFRTRYTPVLALSGMLTLAAAAGLLLAGGTKGSVPVAVGAALIGYGVGASVSPALFIAGFSLRSAQIQRVFALIELLRGVTAFLVAPVLLFLATVLGKQLTKGIHLVVWICLGIAGLGLVVAAVIWRTGGPGLQQPDLERWNEGEPAWRSPELLARVRSRA